MTKEEALKVLEVATSSLKGTRQEHVIILEALKVLREGETNGSAEKLS